MCYYEYYKNNIKPGDTIQVTTYGYTTKGFIGNEFMISRSLGSDEIKIISWLLIENSCKFVFFSPNDNVVTSRIVLTEKIKFPKLNEEFNKNFFEAKMEFDRRKYFFKSRQTGMDMVFANSLIYNVMYKEEQIVQNFKGIPRNK